MKRLLVCCTLVYCLFFVSCSSSKEAKEKNFDLGNSFESNGYEYTVDNVKFISSDFSTWTDDYPFVIFKEPRDGKSCIVVEYSIKNNNKNKVDGHSNIDLVYDDEYSYNSELVAEIESFTSMTGDHWNSGLIPIEPLESFKMRAYFFVPKEIEENSEKSLKLEIDDFIYNIR